MKRPILSQEKIDTYYGDGYLVPGLRLTGENSRDCNNCRFGSQSKIQLLRTAAYRSSRTHIGAAKWVSNSPLPIRTTPYRRPCVRANSTPATPFGLSSKGDRWSCLMCLQSTALTPMRVFNAAWATRCATCRRQAGSIMMERNASEFPATRITHGLYP